MKKLIAVILFAVSVPSMASPVPSLIAGGIGAGGSAAGAGPVGVGFVMGVLIARNYDKPIPYNLTDACKAQTVKKEGANYSYTTFEGCIK